MRKIAIIADGKTSGMIISSGIIDILTKKNFSISFFTYNKSIEVYLKKKFKNIETKFINKEAISENILLKIFRITRAFAPHAAGKMRKKVYVRAICRNLKINNTIATFLAKLFLGIMKSKFVRKTFLFIEHMLTFKLNQMPLHGYDVAILFGIGDYRDFIPVVIARLLKKNGAKLICCVGNYDYLVSKGYKGVNPDVMTVWGNLMKEDAVKFHDMHEEKLRIIGSPRYDSLKKVDKYDARTTLGLSKHKYTILFAGGVFPEHYFEILYMYNNNMFGSNSQLIIRVYPSNKFRNSHFMPGIIELSKKYGVLLQYSSSNENYNLPDLDNFVYNDKSLWLSINACDLCINIASTINVEAMMLEKSCVIMWYFPFNFNVYPVGPQFYEIEDTLHRKRLKEVAKIPIVTNREELSSFVLKQIMRRDEKNEFQKSAKKHCNELISYVDGNASLRLASLCENIAPARLAI